LPFPYVNHDPYQMKLYSTRQSLQNNTSSEYQYNIPGKFRGQFIEMLKDSRYVPRLERLCNGILVYLRRAYGMEHLIAPRLLQYTTKHPAIEELLTFFKQTGDHNQCIDIIEMASVVICNERSNEVKEKYLNELEDRFKENNLGYRFIGNTVIKLDANHELLHMETVKPVLQLLSDKDYKSANDEFLAALNLHRTCQYADANHKFRKALESTMRIICDKRKYKYQEGKATVNHLLQTLKDNDFFSDLYFLDKQLNTLIELCSSTGKIANRQGSHGEGSNPKTIPAHLTGYLLHITAAVILFLVEIEKQKQPHTNS
jgi:hypothetical protein